MHRILRFFRTTWTRLKEHFSQEQEPDSASKIYVLESCLSQKGYDQLEALRNCSDLTHEEVLRHALALFDLLTEVTLEGSTIIIRDSDGDEEILKLPFLQEEPPDESE